MNEYKYQLRIPRRGDWCVLDKCKYDGDYSRERSRNGLCGCGTRIRPSKQIQSRIVRRVLQRQLRSYNEDSSSW